MSVVFVANRGEIAARILRSLPHLARDALGALHHLAAQRVLGRELTAHRVCQRVVHGLGLASKPAHQALAHRVRLRLCLPRAECAQPHSPMYSRPSTTQSTAPQLPPVVA